MPVPPYFTDNNQDELRAATRFQENSRAARLNDISNALATEQQARSMTTGVAVDQAIRDSYAQTPQAPLSQDTSGAPNITSGQQQVQQVPVSANSAVPPQQLSGAAPMDVAQVSSADLQPPPPGNASAIRQQVPKPPPANAFPPSVPNGAPEATNIVPPSGLYNASPMPVPAPKPPVPSQPPMPQEKPQVPLPSATPFDSPQFQQNLAQHLAQIQGGGAELMKIKGDRDAALSGIFTMIANGHTDEARYTAQRNGFQLPEQFYQNSDLAQGMALGSKAYPEDADKGQVFFKAFTAAQGSLTDKVGAGMQAAGPPTSQAQKELLKAMAVMRSNYQIKNPDGSFGLAFANPMTGTLTPYKTPDGNSPNVTGGYAFHAGNTGGAGAGGVTQSIIDNLRKENPNLSYADALALAKRAPNANQDELRRENLAYQAATNDFAYKNPDGSRASLEQKINHYRQVYGIGNGSALRNQAQPAQVIGPAYDALGNPSSVPMQNGNAGMVHVQGPQGDKYWIQPSDLQDALKDGYQQVP